MPVDADPVEGGNVMLDRSVDPPLASVLTRSDQITIDEALSETYRSHFVSCPHSKRWRLG